MSDDRRRRYWVSFPLVTLLALALVVSPAITRANVGDSFSGYQSGAAGQAVSVRWVLPGVFPVEAPLDWSLSLSRTTVSSGGNAFARSSPVYPGDLLANLGPLIGVGFGQEEFAAMFPEYPLVAEARQFDGAVVRDIGAMRMRAYGAQDEARAESASAAVDVPGFISIGSVVSRARSTVDDSRVASGAEVKMSEIALLGGLITIDGLRTESYSASNGHDASVDGTADLTGVEILGVPVTVGREGFHFAGQDAPGPIGAVADPLIAAIEAMNIEMELLEGGDQIIGNHGEHFTSGVAVTLHLPELDFAFLAEVVGPVLANFPPFPFNVPFFVPESKLIFILGSVNASASANPPFAFDFPSDSIPGGAPSVPTMALPTTQVSESLPDLPPAAAPSGVEAPPRPQPMPFGGEPAAAFDYEFPGIPLGLIVMLGVAGAVGVRFLHRYVHHVLSLDR